jgi:antitoxin FitA
MEATRLDSAVVTAPPPLGMRLACYAHAVSAIQVKNVSPDLHAQLRARARVEGRSLSDYVLDVLKRDLSLPTMSEWLDRLGQDEPVMGLSSEQIVRSIREGREERDGQVQRALTHRD